MLNPKSKIYLAGHKGMVGSAIYQLLEHHGFTNLVVATKEQLDLTNQAAVADFFAGNRPEIVILCAAKVGGIQANIDNPATFLLDNLQIQNNLIASAQRYGVSQFVFLGSSCIYPTACPQPMKEEYLLTGPLEPTNEGYAIAKIAGLKLLEGMRRQHGLKSISLMPCNLYGPNDSFDLAHSHVLSALVKRFVDATESSAENITLWGTGNARREFMHVDDMARAVLYMMDNYHSSTFINIGTGEDISIRDLACMISELTGYRGRITWDHAKPDGMLRKCMDVTRMKAVGFSPSITLRTGVEQMISIYKRGKQPR